MRILLVGLPYFTERLYRELVAFDKQNTYYRLDTYYSKKDRLKALLLIPFVDIVYSINGTLGKSRAIDLALKKKKRVMMTWVGTDVTKAKLLAETNQSYLKNVEHYCEVEWIQNELKELNIKAEILNFFNFSDEKEFAQASGEQLHVLTYISKDRELYYGWKEIIAAAKDHPEVIFSVVGTEGLEGKPDNVNCYGWVEDMDPLFEKANCTIRFVAHDGLSGFVLESLLRGKQVIYSEPLVHCINAKNGSEISAALTMLNLKFVNGESLLNKEGRDFVKKNFNSEYILNRLIETFKK